MAVLVGAVALVGSGSISVLGLSMRDSIANHTRVASAEATVTTYEAPQIGGHHEAAGALARVLRVATSAMERSVDAINALDQLPLVRGGLTKELSTSWVARAHARWDAQITANGFASDFLPDKGLRPAAEALQPAPAGWTQLMGWMTDSYTTGRPSSKIRDAYDVALTKTIPTQLTALRRAYLQAIEAFGSDYELGMSRNPLLMLAALEDTRTRAIALAAKKKVSAHEIAELAHSLNYAQGGRRPPKMELNFTPIFSDSVLPASPDLYVDALVAARSLRFEGKPVLFPHEFPAPGSPLVRAKQAEVAAGISKSVESFFDSADRHTTFPDLWPEGIRRRRFVQAVFPEHPFTAVDALDPDHRAMVRAFYARVLRPSAARRKYKFRGYYRLHEEVAADLKAIGLEDALMDIVGFPMPN